MGSKFRKRVKLLGLKWNFGKQGLTSVSAGKKGLTTTWNFKKGVSSTASIPSTGISYQHKWGNKTAKPPKLAAQKAAEWNEWSHEHELITARFKNPDDVEARELAIAASNRAIALCHKYGSDPSVHIEAISAYQAKIEEIKNRQAEEEQRAADEKAAEWEACRRGYDAIGERLKVNNFNNDDIEARELAIACCHRAIALCNKYGGDATAYTNFIAVCQAAIEDIKSRQAKAADVERQAERVKEMDDLTAKNRANP